MPWIVKKEGSEYCVFKKGGGKVACHKTRKEATQQMRALYANSKEFSEVAEGLLTMLRPLRFSEAEIKGDKLVKWIQAFPYGQWDHPIWGMTYFSKHNAETMKMNFSERVHGKDILTTDFEHGMDISKGTKSSGNILDMDVREDGMWWLVEFTPTATKEIEDGEWNYFSPEYYEVYENHMNGEIHADVATGGALTNKPWIKGMMPINLSEVLVDKGVLNRDEQTGEVAWQEHHDPDQDPDQQPKPEDPQGGDDRFHPNPLPVQKEADEEQEASVEITAAMLTALGLPEDATEEQVEAAITTAAAALTSTQADEEAAKLFSERFPEQHRIMTEQATELERLRKKDAERDAELFGKSFSEFVIKVKGETDGDDGDDGGDEVEVRKGFSALVCDQLTELHKKFSEGVATPDDLKPILEKIVAGDGIVEYGERGSRTEDTDETQAANPQEAAIKLSEIATKLQNEAGGPDKLSWGDALAQASNQNPELAKLYRDRSGKEG